MTTRSNASPVQERVAQLFEEARDDVYRYLISLGLYPPQAQEVTQEVFLRLYQTLCKGEDIRSDRAWIFKVAHNQGLKVRAKQAQQPPYDPGIELRLSDPGADPERSLLERERLRRLHKALEEALQRIESEVATPHTQHLVDFIRASKRGICRE